MKYRFIQDHRKEHRISRLCSVLAVSTSGYYAWQRRPESPRRQANHRLLTHIHAFHRASRGIYGSPRIHQDLVAAGESCGVHRVARLMRRHGIQSKMARKFVITTDSRNTAAPAPDRLQRQFDVAAPNVAWVTDTTFIATRQGWMYLAVVLDLYSRQLIGWAMSQRNNSPLVEDALTMAIQRRAAPRDVIVHSDQGSTYASGSYQQLMAEHGLQCSMSRKGECLDNAVAESFFGTLKTELTNHEDYWTRTAARQSLFEYMEVFYNRQRRHSYLNYLTPVEYETRNAPN
jgi:transposase InsO family protein